MPSPASSSLGQLKVLALALMSAPLVLAVAIAFSLDDSRLREPAPWALVVVAVVGLASAAALQTFGYRVQPLTTSADRAAVGDQARAQFQSGMMVRFVISEVPVLVGIAVAFVVGSGGLWVYLVGMVVGLLLMARHVWPGEHPIGRAEQAFERAGTTAWLREALQRPPTAGHT